MIVSEPLIAPTTAIRIHEAFVGHMVDDPEWGARLAGGVAASLSEELGDDDPWRRLSARVGDMRRGSPPRGGDHGAWRPDGTPFGTWRDESDVVEVVFAEVDLDVAFAAVALDDLGPGGASVLAFAADGPEAASQAIVELGEVASRADAAEAALAAVRWLSHRYRAKEFPASLPAMTPGLILSWSWRSGRGGEDDPDFDPASLR